MSTRQKRYLIIILIASLSAASLLAILLIDFSPIEEEKIGKIPPASPPAAPGPREITAPKQDKTPSPEAKIEVPHISLRGIVYLGDQYSQAMIRDEETGKERFYRQGEEIGNFLLKEVYEDRIVLCAQETEIVLRLAGVSGADTDTTSPTVRKVSDKHIDKWRNLRIKTKEEVYHEVSGYLNELAKLWPSVYDTNERLDFPNTRETSEGNWEVGREDAGKLIRNAGKIFNQVELVPQIEGFKINFRPGQGSVWEEIGFQDKDIIVKINEINITGIGRMVAAARSAQGKGRAEVKLIRRGKILTQTYQVRD